MNRGTSLHEAVSALRTLRADHTAAQGTEERVLRTLQTRARRRRFTRRALAGIGLCLFVATGTQAAYLGVDDALRRAATFLGVRAETETARRPQHTVEAPARASDDESVHSVPSASTADAGMALRAADTIVVLPSDRATLSAQKRPGERRLARASGREVAPVESTRVEPTAEERYAEAHRLHFVDGNKHDALLSWERYLAVQPSGRLAPEARYNRSLCLIALGRTQQAIEALSSIAEGVDGDYRQREARMLLRALRAAPRVASPGIRE